MDSFPASDPPGWIRSSAATGDTEALAAEVVDIGDVPSEMPSSTSGPLRRLERIALATGIALAAGAITAFFVVRSRRRTIA